VKRVVELVNDTLLKRNDGVIGDADFLRANFGAAFRDVAETQTELVAEKFCAGDAVKRVHFEAGNAHEETGAGELVVFVVIAQDVADVLAKKTFDTLAEFLNAVNILLEKFPFRAGARLERRDFFVDLVVP
jgi:hypothetical protein